LRRSGPFRNRLWRTKVREALELEPGLIPLALLSLGYPAELLEPSSRRRLDEVVAWR
jgi:nitroreductase